jgi:hypothetical protein
VKAGLVEVETGQRALGASLQLLDTITLQAVTSSMYYLDTNPNISLNTQLLAAATMESLHISNDSQLKTCAQVLV